MLSREQLLDLYRRRARNYDITANLYYLIGFREQASRRRAVAALALSPGDTVVEIGCGTGLNFALLQQGVGPTGRIVGVDLTDAMLARARVRVTRRGWANVELVQSDAARYAFPPGVRGVLSTFALTLVPEYDDVVRRAAQALAPGGRIAVADLKAPDRAPAWLVRLAASVARPFGVTLDLAGRHPWESMARYLGSVSMTELYFGFAYIAVAQRALPARGAEAAAPADSRPRHSQQP